MSIKIGKERRIFSRYNFGDIVYFIHNNEIFSREVQEMKLCSCDSYNEVVVDTGDRYPTSIVYRNLFSSKEELLKCMAGDESLIPTDFETSKTIECKLNIDDKIYFMFNNEIHNGVIHSLYIRKDELRFMLNAQSYNRDNGHPDLNGDNVFLSVEELLNSLNKNLETIDNTKSRKII